MQVPHHAACRWSNHWVEDQLSFRRDAVETFDPRSGECDGGYVASTGMLRMKNDVALATILVFDNLTGRQSRGCFHGVS
jgi:hypothetical protein